ncbi:MAG TPA: NAD(P)/FAD-dependent oxidoreductase [Verrucomicrobiae bacterium]
MRHGKSVIVIGGGISGLAAAHELLQDGCRVTVLEAKNRLGGRIHTLHDTSCPIELGAEFVHGRSEPFLSFLKEAHIPIEQGPEDNHVLTNGQLIDVDLWGKTASALEKVNIWDSDQSCSEFLHQQNLLMTERRQIIEMLQGFHAAPIQALSAHAIRRSDYSSSQMDGNRQSRLSNGYSEIITHLEKSMRSMHGHILLNSPVKRIVWQPGSVEIFMSHDDGEEVHRADSAVITLPLGVLKHGDIEFHPALHEKHEAIHGLGFGTVTKVILLFTERWWKPDDIGLVHSYEERLPTWWSDSRGPLLTGWAGGPKGEELAGIPLPVLETIALESLSHIFGENKSSLKKLLRQTFSHDWINDRHVMGAYSYVPINGLDLPKLLAAPLKETLFFAGEAAIHDAQTGMTFNAYQSGVRAAHEVMAAEHHSNLKMAHHF